MRIQTYGGVPVPYTVSWSAEESFHVAHCPHGRGIAICQAVAPGQGKPRFGKPHSQRQREAIAFERHVAATYRREAKNRSKNPALVEQLLAWAEASDRRVEAMRVGPLFGTKE
jgi:hypothetical protein